MMRYDMIQNEAGWAGRGGNTGEGKGGGRLGMGMVLEEEVVAGISGSVTATVCASYAGEARIARVWKTSFSSGSGTDERHLFQLIAQGCFL